jgi:pyrimidine-nucleoside phosphorylase
MAPPPTAVSLITKKRDGGELSDAELRWLVAGYVRGDVPDYQMSAFAMAVVLRGMSVRETATLTLAMRDSGKRARIDKRGGPRVDKHSTGGVGDKVSICLAPLAAACGLQVPMISGRGLGHTGGTLDKLEAIPGFRVDLPLPRFQDLVREHGFALIGQTADLAPADRKLYALRDVTGTVESIPLITASILSKKLCEDLDALVLDIKVGRGAFMKTRAQARELAQSMVRVAEAAGTPVHALLTRMDAPLGRTIGNALETAEAFEVLHGGGPEDLRECTIELLVEMLRAAGERNEKQARKRIHAALASGAAVKRMERLVAAQGGDPRVVREPDRLPVAPVKLSVHAKKTGFVRGLDALQLAHVALRLGAGRLRSEDTIDPRVGLVLRRSVGERVTSGEVIAEVHALSDESAAAEAVHVAAAYDVVRSRPADKPLVIERLRP